jgi:predicted metal-binding membrane protein
MTIAAARSQPLASIAVLAAAGVAWWVTAERMAGMDAGPGTDLGSLGWFAGVWAVMMAAMMLPSFAPTAAAYAESARRDRWLLVVGGYLLVWCVAGLVAYGLFELGKGVLAGELAWDEGGRWVAAGVLAVGGAYQLTPLKANYLSRCRSPHRLLKSSSRPRSASGALAIGIRAGGWCIGCTWALMVALFALGVMSLTWMALIAALVMLEKLSPWRRAATLGAAVILLALAVGIAAAPGDVPGLVVPGSPGAAHAMKSMMS